MDIKILVRKGVFEALMLLGEAEGNSALGEELRDKTGMTRKRLGLLVDEGVLDKTDERVLVKTVPIKRRVAAYNISDKGKRLLEICEGLSDQEAREFTGISPRQLDVLKKILLEEGVQPGEISKKIAEETGMSYRWVMKYLPDRFKDEK